MYKGDARKVLTGEVRLSYVHLSAPWVNPLQPNGEPKYQTTILLPKLDAVTKADIDSAMNAAVTAAVNSKTWNGVRPPKISIPIHDGDGTKEKSGEPYGPECKGMWVLTASRRAQDGRPWISDISNHRVELAPEDIYSGMYARCTIRFFGYNHSGTKGIGCALDGVLKTRDGESLGGAVKPTADEFSELFMDEPGPGSGGGAATGTYQINPVTGQPYQINPVTGLLE